MIITKYPKWVEVQLKILDERIEEIYRECMNVKVKPDDAMQIKQNIAELIKPFVDEKVRLITNSCPTYMIIKELEDDTKIAWEAAEHSYSIVDNTKVKEYDKDHIWWNGKQFISLNRVSEMKREWLDRSEGDK